MIAIEDIKREHGAEMGAIILCCRVFFETATTNDLIAFIDNNDIDWYTFVRLASIHRIRPTVCKIVHSVALPPDIKVLIYRQQADITKKNWVHAIETERIILLLDEHNIKAVPYKGAAFSKQFFGDLVSRESSDIDLIIKPEDLPKAIAILKQDEYLPELDDVYKYLGKKFTVYYKDYNFNKYKGGKREFHIELHWAIAESYLNVNTKVNALIYKADDSMVLAKADVNVLNRNAHFASILIHHSIKDTFKYLKNIVDVSQALRHEDMQDHYNELKASFTAFGLQKTLSVSNQLSQQLMGIDWLKAENVNGLERTLNHFRKQLCSQQILEGENVANIFRWIKNRILLQDSFLQKMSFYFVSGKHRFIPTEVDFKFVKFPKPVFFLYYVIKPFRSVIRPFDVTDRKRNLISAN